MNLAEKIITFFKEKKKTGGILILLALGLLLLAISAIPSESTVTEEGQTLAEYKAELEAELEDACTSVQGVGKCRVIVTFERGAENTYKGSALIESKPPAVMGITVICRGGDSDAVKRELTEMLSALFGIGTNRIAVMKLDN